MNELKRKIAIHSARSQRLNFQQMREERRGQPLPVQLSKIVLFRATGRLMMHSLGEYLGGYNYVGSGFEQLVFRSPDHDHILKLRIDTMGSRPTEIDEFTKKSQALSDTARDYLGEHWIHTDFMTHPLPHWLGGRTVAAVQPVVEPVAVFARPEEVAEYDSSPGYQGELGSLAEAIRQLNDDTGLYPDLLGEGNVLLAPTNGGNRLQIVDTMVETPEKLTELVWYRAASRQQVMTEIVTMWERASAPRERYESPLLAVR